MSSTKRAIGLYSTGGCVLIAAVCVLINLVSYRYSFRLDFTENKIYSLSPSTGKLLSRLTDPLRVKVFFDEGVPPEYAHQRRYLAELLQEMSAASSGNLRVEMVDMKKPESKDEARKAGIAPLRFTVVRQDKFEVQEGMMGLAIFYEDKKEVIPAVTQTANIEYEIANRVVKLTQSARPVVGWTMGNEELEPPDELRQYLSQNFEYRELRDHATTGWLKADSVPALSALIVAGPKETINDTGLRSIDRAIMSGIPTALLADFYDVHMGQFFVRKNRSGLDKLLTAYGVTSPEGLVVDAQNVPVQMQSQQGFFMMQTMVNYPYIPRVTDLSQDHAVTRSLTEIAMPYVSALQFSDSSGVSILARSSPESYRLERTFFVGPTQQISIEGAAQGPFVFAAAIQGQRKSAFGDTTSEVRLLVFSSSTFLDQTKGFSAGNLALTANLVDWLAATDDLISIRSKTNTYRPLQKVSDRKRGLIKASNLFLMPLLVALAGAIRWQIRSARRRRAERAA